jgi:hypothetical protein
VRAAVESGQEHRAEVVNGFYCLPISQSEAQTLDFPPGHPRSKVLYIGHPAVPTLYYTTAQFHRFTFEHKLSEAVRLLMSLGATRIEVEHVAGWGNEFSAHLNVGLGPAVSGTTTVEAKRQSDMHLLFVAKLIGSASPVLPPNLIWYHHEPTWQQVAEGRLKYGLQDFTLTVRYEDDFGVNANLKMSAQSAGLDLGGAFEDHKATVWRMVGEFGTPVQALLPQTGLSEA